MPIIKFAQFFVKTRHAHRHKSNFLVGPGRVQLATDHMIHEEGYTQEKEHSPPKKETEVFLTWASPQALVNLCMLNIDL